jgi:hypothetical protein
VPTIPTATPSTNGKAPTPPKGLQRAKLEIEGGVTIQCWFNPKEYTVSKSNEWTIKPVVGKGLPAAQFGGGQARELSLDLLFDASDDPDYSVRAVTDDLFRAMEISPDMAGSSGKNSARPPYITFVWGETVSFTAVAKQLSVQYLLFRGDGTPIRAQAKLSLVQVEPARDATSKSNRSATQPPPQNPTTRGLTGTRTHVMRDGDSLQSIAYAAYGDATRWRLIAEANGIDDPMRLPRRGEALAIPGYDG